MSVARDPKCAWCLATGKLMETSDSYFYPYTVSCVRCSKKMNILHMFPNLNIYIEF
jgi:hypothetical protein